MRLFLETFIVTHRHNSTIFSCLTSRIFSPSFFTAVCITPFTFYPFRQTPYIHLSSFSVTLTPHHLLNVTISSFVHSYPTITIHFLHYSALPSLPHLAITLHFIESSFSSFTFSFVSSTSHQIKFIFFLLSSSPLTSPLASPLTFPLASPLTFPPLNPILLL